MPIKIETFSGEMPARHPRLLPPNGAQVASNVLLDRGSLRPLRAPAVSNTLAVDADNIILHRGTWIPVDDNAWAAPGPVADDRLYITSDDAPVLLFEGVSRPLVLAAPTSGPSAVPNAAVDTTLAESTVFTYTYVTDLGEESQPAPLSGAIALDPEQTAAIGGFTAPPTGRGITRRRIYKSVTSLSAATGLFFVHEEDVGNGTLTFDPELHPAGEALPSADYDPAPANMQGIITMPNGMMAAFAGQELMFCEPFLPHAWPIKYRLKTDYPIVALSAFGTMLAIMTEGTPYRAQGTHPDQMQMEKIEQNLPCVAARGAVDVGYAAVYPSSEGLVTMSADNAVLVTRGLLTLDQWVALRPETFIASQWSGQYVASHLTAADARITRLFNLQEGNAYITRSPMQARAWYHDIRTGFLYALIGARSIQRWHAPASDDATFTWRSAVYDVRYPISFAVAVIEGVASASATPEVALNIYADGQLIHTITEMNVPRKLPAILAQEWQVEIVSNAEIQRVVVAEDMEALGR